MTSPLLPHPDKELVLCRFIFSPSCRVPVSDLVAQEKQQLVPDIDLKINYH